MKGQTAELLGERQIIASGHFVLNSGVHSDEYVRKDLIVAQPIATDQVAEEMSEAIHDQFGPDGIDTLVGIAPCSAILASHVGRILTEKWSREIVTVFAEKVPQLARDESGRLLLNNAGEPQIIEPLALKRGYDELLRSTRGVAIEDIVTSAKTLFELQKLLATVPNFALKGVSAVVSRNMAVVNEEYLGMGRWMPIVERDVTSWPEDECRLCEDLEAHPINTALGKGAKFLERKAAEA